MPRWNGDTNFMTVLGETRVISQHLQETYAILRPHFAGAFASLGASAGGADSGHAFPA